MLLKHLQVGPQGVHLGTLFQGRSSPIRFMG
jgi:hypothetical protein